MSEHNGNDPTDGKDDLPEGEDFTDQPEPVSTDGGSAGDGADTSGGGGTPPSGSGIERLGDFFKRLFGRRGLKHPSMMILWTSLHVLGFSIIVDTILTWIASVFIDDTFWAYQLLAIIPVSLIFVFKVLKVESGKIDIGWQALPLFLGKRSTSVYHEGYFVVPTLYFQFEAVDTRSLLADLGSLSVSVKGSVGEAIGEDISTTRVEIEFDPSIDYRVLDIYTFLSVEGFLGKLKSSAESSIRVIVESLNDLQVFSLGEGLEIQLKEKLEKGEEGTLGDAESWGIEIIRLSITDIDYFDEDLKKKNSALRLAAIDNRKTIERSNSIVEAGKKIKDGLGVEGEYALSTVNADLGIQTLREVRVTGNASQLVQAAELLNNSGG